LLKLQVLWITFLSFIWFNYVGLCIFWSPNCLGSLIMALRCLVSWVHTFYRLVGFVNFWIHIVQFMGLRIPNCLHLLAFGFIFCWSFLILWVLKVFFTLLVVVGVNSNCRVHLDILPLVLCIQIGSGCWWVITSCDFVQLGSILCNSNTFTIYKILTLTLLLRP